MSNLRVVDADVLEADLTSVADKIREKAGGEEKLAFPSGFESALDTIESADSALAEVEYMMSNGYTDYSSWFQYLPQLTEVPMGILQHTSNATNFKTMFYSCKNLVEIPAFDTSNGTNFSSFCYSCDNLETVGGINITNATNISGMFNYSTKLTNITFDGVIKLTGLYFAQHTLLTHDSLMSAINALYDYASEGTTGTFKLTLGSTNLAKLTDAEKAIATQKGWTLL